MSGDGILSVDSCFNSRGQAAPSLTAVLEAKGAAHKLIETTKRVPKIDSASDDGIKIDHVQGAVTFESIDFSYPARPDAQIFNNFNLEVEAGQTVALVGPSGRQVACCGVPSLFLPRQGL